MLEQFYQNKRNILKKSQEFFLNSTSLTIKIGCELEFFLLQKNSQDVADQGLVEEFIAEIENDLIKKFPLIYRIEKERGESQIEVKTTFSADLLKVGEELENAKNFIKNFAKAKDLTASFAAQPFLDDCGSALQLNISLHDKDDKNLFESDANLLKNIANSLLQATDSMMIFLAPQAEDYARFSFESNRNLFKKGKFTAPVNLSFGSDNRTCAIRIPTLVQGSKYGKRLEYRIAAADADFFLVTAAILLALRNEESDLVQIHGNAFDEQYRLKKFCGSLEEAREAFKKEKNFIREAFLSLMPMREESPL